MEDDVYDGETKNGQPHGQGTYTFADGSSKYVGEWKDDKQHGRCISLSADGTKYVGEFKDGKPWDGVFYAPDGMIGCVFKVGVPQRWCPLDS